MTYMEFAASESSALEPTPWDRWITRLEKLLGHDLDGNQATDGYSLDRSNELFDAGKTPSQASYIVLWEKHGLHRSF